MKKGIYCCGGIVLKLDFEKAFDCVDSDFLLQFMEAMGFGSGWISSVKECISIVRVAVLVNGSATNEFAMSHGIRQSNPLPPFLFLLEVEVLHLLLSKVEYVQLFRGISSSSSGLCISHLQFADDTIIFWELVF